MFEEAIAGEVLGGGGFDDLLNLGGDNIARAEFLVIENFAEDAFGEEVLAGRLVYLRATAFWTSLCGGRCGGRSPRSMKWPCRMGFR